MKEKESYYNNIVELNNKILLFNSYSKAYLILSDKLYDSIKDSRKDFNILERSNRKLYELLKDNGFIVNNDYDEVTYVNNLRFNNKFNNSEYNLIINPTMDCNLKCWYCYENHIDKSLMNIEIADRILKHIKLQFKIMPFKKLHLSFFGGEPLMNKKIIIYIVEQVSLFTKKNNIDFDLSFTSNGTLINDSFVEFLSNYKVGFQITLDGDKVLHNDIRFFKKSQKGSYDCILKNIKKITERIENSFINLRINFSDNTLEKINESIKHLEAFVNKEKIIISLHKIWQIDESSIDKEKIFETISNMKAKGFKVNFPYLEIGTPCYADSFHQAVINYDGKTYKCTARNFSKNAAEGELLSNGIINWDIEKRLYRHYVNAKSICYECKLLPACPGLCSQNCLEQKETKCHFENSFFSKNDFIVYNFNKEFQT